MQAKINFSDLNYRLWLGALALLVFASALLSSPPALSQAFPGGGGRNAGLRHARSFRSIGVKIPGLSFCFPHLVPAAFSYSSRE